MRHSLQPFTDIGYPVSQFPQHVTVAEAMASKLKKLFEGYFKFTIVRNPYDRLYSGFQQDFYAASQWQQWQMMKKPIFDRIGENFNRYMQEYVAKANLYDAWDWVCFFPMSSYSHYEDNYVLDWYGKSENLTEDIDHLSGLLDVNIEKSSDQNVRVEPSSELKYIDKYDRATVALVNQIYAKDFEFFGYEKLNPEDFPEQR